MPEPSVKGILLQGAVERINDHLEQGTISREVIEARLEKADVEALDRKIVSAAWYPIEIYGRIVALVSELEGGMTEQDHIRGGATDARRMMESGLYQQFELFQRMDSHPDDSTFEQRFHELGRTLRLAISVSKTVFNFSEWSVLPDPDFPQRFRVEVTDAAPLFDSNVIGAVGFLNECCGASRSSNPIRWSVERPQPDLVIYRMNRDYV